MWSSHPPAPNHIKNNPHLLGLKLSLGITYYFVIHKRKKKLAILFNPNDTDVFFDACVPGGSYRPPPWKIDFYTRKGQFFFMTWILAWNQLNFEVYYLFLAQFWQILAISSLKLPKNFKFFKNWARNELYSSKESWDHLKIDFMAKKYDLFEKKTKKMNFLIFWLKIGRIWYLPRPISQNFQKKTQKFDFTSKY